jgi:hypothetical protein
MEEIKFKKNELVLNKYYIVKEGSYLADNLVECALEIDGNSVVAYQANYLKHGEHV